MDEVFIFQFVTKQSPSPKIPPPAAISPSKGAFSLQLQKGTNPIFIKKNYSDCPILAQHRSNSLLQPIEERTAFVCPFLLR
jgi:hypothetical protein